MGVGVVLGCKVIGVWWVFKVGFDGGFGGMWIMNELGRYGC